jgi:hypothetical protein
VKLPTTGEHCALREYRLDPALRDTTLGGTVPFAMLPSDRNGNVAVPYLSIIILILVELS